MEPTAIVLQVLKKAEKPLRAGDIADLAGLDKKDVEKAMKKLKDEDLITSPQRCFWQPKS